MDVKSYGDHTYIHGTGSDDALKRDRAHIIIEEITIIMKSNDPWLTERALFPCGSSTGTRWPTDRPPSSHGLFLEEREGGGTEKVANVANDGDDAHNDRRI